MSWEFDNSIPIYIQLVEKIKLLIASGELNSGDKLKSVRDLAQEAGVNPNTMQRALAELEREELIYSVRTCGRFVTQEDVMISAMRGKIAKDRVNILFETLFNLGYTIEEISKIVIEKIDDYRKGEQNAGTNEIY